MKPQVGDIWSLYGVDFKITHSYNGSWYGTRLFDNAADCFIEANSYNYDKPDSIWKFVSHGDKPAMFAKGELANSVSQETKPPVPKLTITVLKRRGHAID